jgi:shikimate kinase
MIFFIGYTASGKTTIAKRLANYLNLPFIDLDAQIEKEIQSDISSFFKTKGEEVFRLAENLTLKSTIRYAPKNAIIACGGGTPCYYDNIELMKLNGFVVYLETPLNKIMSHLMYSNRSARPTIANNNLINRDELKKHFAKRLPFYEQAHFKSPLKMAKNPELLTMTLILFTNSLPTLRKSHILF